MKLILASTSPTRRKLLESLKVPFSVEAPFVEEDFPVGTQPEEAVQLLAERKARAVFQRNPDAFVIGSDQMAVLEGRILGKPPHQEAAFQQLRSMSGKTHQLCTGLCLMGPHFFQREVDIAHLTLHALEDTEIERYLALNEWVGCAGSYQIEAAGQALFSDVRGDRTSIMGLPMLRLTHMLRHAGLSFFHP